MTAICAMCRSAILRGAKFLLLGSEVVHASCVGTGRLTITRNQQLEISRLQAELSAAREATARAVVERDRARNEAQRGFDESLRMQTERQRTQLELSVALRDHAAQREQLNSRLLALERQVAGYQVAAAESANPESEVQEDATETRFRLLEFD